MFKPNTLRIKALALTLSLALVMSFSCTGCSRILQAVMDVASDTLDENLGTDSNRKKGTGDLEVNPSDEDMYFYRKGLTGKEKRIYDQICDQLNREERSFFVEEEKTTHDEFFTASTAVMLDHPEFFWVDYSATYYHKDSSGFMQSVAFGCFTFAGNDDKFKEAKEKFNAAADAIVEEALKLDNVTDREIYIHDALCDMTRYDTTYVWETNQSAYSCLVENKSVCAGYSRAFQYFMHRLGIPCYVVLGTTDDWHDKPNHMWNMVRINGGYYNVDVTWDDSLSESHKRKIYPFFNISDEENIKHIRLDEGKALPACTDSTYSYSNVYGRTVTADKIKFKEKEAYS